MHLTLIGLLLALALPVPFAEGTEEDSVLVELCQLAKTTSRTARPARRAEPIVASTSPAAPSGEAPVREGEDWTPRRLSRPPPL